MVLIPVEIELLRLDFFFYFPIRYIKKEILKDKDNSSNIETKKFQLKNSNGNDFSVYFKYKNKLLIRSLSIF